MPSVILTTAGNLPNDQRYEIIDVITSECVMGMNVFRDIFAGVRDFFGGKSVASQNVLRDLKEECLAQLREEAAAQGANAVIGVDLDYSEFSGGGKSMLFLVASGTAVRTTPG
ncbi:MAG: YbjQ family protein [Pseudomonadales bacterium]